MKYQNREYSWLKFNERVLNEATEKQLSLKDRLKFVSIFSSNLDEFMMVRVGSLYDLMQAKSDSVDMVGLSAKEQLDGIYAQSRKLVLRQQEIFFEILSEAKGEGLIIEPWKGLSKSEQNRLQQYFMSDIYPVLTPLAVDQHRPFPLIANMSLYFALKIEHQKKMYLSLLQIPGILPRLIPIEKSAKKARYIYLEDLIEQHLDTLYPNMSVCSVGRFRITRNGDLTVSDEGAEDLLSQIESTIRKRKWGQIIRLEVVEGMDEGLIKQLIKNLQVEKEQLFTLQNPLDLKFTMHVEGPVGNAAFQASRHEPKKVLEVERKNLFNLIKKQDIFFHVPYDSFHYIEQLIEQAAEDEQVLAIKMTLYRVNNDSNIVRSLQRATLNGKQVTVLVELMARFDEENNIQWARELEKVGANVIYGVPTLKTHSKIFLIVRKERNVIKRYVHLATGNYNSKTARIYTDMSILTCREDIATDASTFFNLISGYADNPNMSRLVYAPERLRKRIVSLIEQEMQAASKGKSASIAIKVNSLIDQDMIDKLYQASNAGVKIRLIVRGICGLIPGVKGQSEHIEVRSIVGEFLEHERIYAFENAHPEGLYLSSADLMTRNLDRRVELMFPVLDEIIAKRILNTFELLWADDTKSSLLLSDGNYVKQVGGRIHAQQILKEMIYTSNKDFNRQVEAILHGL